MKTKIIHTPDMLKAASRKKEATVFMPASFDKKDELSALIRDEKYYIHTYGCQANVRGRNNAWYARRCWLYSN